MKANHSAVCPTSPSPVATGSARSLMLVVSLALVGCAVGPDYRKPEPNVRAHWSRLDTSDDSMMYGGTTGDLSQWWRNFEDALLTELVEQAQKSSPDLRKARARLREVRARRTAAAAGQIPSVSMSASASRKHSDIGTSTEATSNQFSAGFDASWELDVFGGVRRGIEAAEADLASVTASLDDTRVSLIAELARDYFEVRSLQIRLGIARNNLASQSETLQLTDWRARAGLVSTQDVEQARSNREQTLAQIPVLQTSLAEAEHRLEILLGGMPGTLHERLAQGGALPAIPSRITVGIPADTLRQRPDVRAAERKLAAETARVGMAQAALLPSFKLSGSIGIEALTRSPLANSGGFFYSLLGGITAPIFNRGKLKSQVEIQDAIREQALVTYEQTVLTALQEVENALVALARNRERSEALSRAAEAARHAAALARQRYSAGVIDFQSVLDTERSVLTLEDSLATTRADGFFALVRLYKALGGGWSPPAEAAAAGPQSSRPQSSSLSVGTIGRIRCGQDCRPKPAHGSLGEPFPGSPETKDAS